jgi:ATP-binding cassette subfamily F protein uup
MAQRGERQSESVRKDEKPKASAPKVKQGTTPAPGLSFTESHRLKELPKVIDRLNAEIAKLEAYLALPDLYTAEPVKFAKGTEALAERQAALAEAEEEWLTLEEKAEAASG